VHEQNEHKTRFAAMERRWQLLKQDKRKYVDRRQYLIRAVHKRRKKIRLMSVESKGGKCERCGYSRCIEALEFHHVDSSAKDFNVSQRGHTRSWKRVVEEIEKCVMLCANCHRELHAELAASGSNVRVISGLSQGNRNVKTTAILSYPPKLKKKVF